MIPKLPAELERAETRRRHIAEMQRANKLFLDREFAAAGETPSGECPITPTLRKIIESKTK